MSSVNYSLKHKGVRLVSSDEAWIKGKNGKPRLNPKYNFVGKVDTRLPNLIVSASDKKKPKFKGNTYDLNRVAKGQMIDHFYDDNGKRNKKTVAYFGIPKEKKS
ncbi:MAG: hypothetical protein IKA62_02150 [Clostridia bacterium]|nr:hypothetical protein [Clostridia bacterium]